MIDAVLHPWRSGLWSALVHTVLDLPVGLVVFVPTAILVGLSLGGAIVVPFALVTVTLLLVWTRLMGRLERSRAAALLGVDLADPVLPVSAGSWWDKIKAVASSRARWKQVGYCLLRLPVSVVLFAVVVGSWAISLALLALPAYVTALPRDTAQFGLFGASLGLAFPLAVVGLCGVTIAAPWLTVGAARVDGWLATRLLGPPVESELTARAERAESGRTAAIDAAEAERRRIERDLHDGAQQRLVALAVDLGAALERIDADPAGARALVAEAHLESKAALREIRDLVRGIHPVILGDRGLDAALSAVVARAPVRVELTIEIGDDRLPDAIESAAYFVVAETLANVARHADADRADIAIVRSGDRLVVEVRDDGVGGADPARGTGLQGLRDRAVALGGTMDVLSPVGGPTTVLVELPCAS